MLQHFRLFYVLCVLTACETNYSFPRSELNQAISPQAVQTFVSGRGLSRVAESIPDILLSMCSGTSQTCALTTLPNGHQGIAFYLGTQSNPLSFELLGMDGYLRADSIARSKIILDMDTLANNVSMRLVNNGIELIMGCPYEDIDDCDGTQMIGGSVDLTLVLENFAGDLACHARNDGANGFVLQSLRVLLKPKITADSQQVPHLIFTDTANSVDEFDVDVSLKVEAANRDPACTDPTNVPWVSDTYECTSFCPGANAVQAIAALIVEQGVIMQGLGDVLVRLITDELSALPTQGGSDLDLSETLPIELRRLNQLKFLLAAQANSLKITPQHLSVAMDLGLAPQASQCVPLAAPQVWTNPVPMNASTVQNGLPPFDAAILMAEVSVQRFMHGLQQSGNLCWVLKAENMADLSNGALVPTVELLSLIASDMRLLAPMSAPFDMSLIPSQIPQVHFNEDNSIGLQWHNVGIEFYPLVDESYIRAFGLTFDLNMQILLTPTETGDLRIEFKQLDISNILQDYNEILAPIDTQALQSLLNSTLTLLVQSQPLEFDFSSLQSVLPILPKILAVKKVGDYLALVTALCRDDENCLLSPQAALAPASEDIVLENNSAETSQGCTQNKKTSVLLLVLPIFLLLKMRRKRNNSIH